MKYFQLIAAHLPINPIVDYFIGIDWSRGVDYVFEVLIISRSVDYLRIHCLHGPRI